MDKNAKKSVLVVEDEPHVLKMLSSELAHEGFDVLEAKNGEEGFKIFNQKHPDLILTNVVMPKMDGLTMAKKIRQSSRGKPTPIIFLTNLHSENSFKKNNEEFKPFFYLVKSSWKIQDVANKVREALRN